MSEGKSAASGKRRGSKEEGTIGTDLRLGRRLLAYLGAHRRLLWVALLLYPLDAATVALPPYLVQQILDVAIPNRDLAFLEQLAWVYLIALLLEYASGFCSQYAMSVLGQRAMRSLRTDVFRHVQRLPARYFDQNPIGRVLTRVTNDVESLAEAFATGAVTVLADLITLLAIVGMMLWLDVKLTLYAFLVVPPLLVLAIVIQRVARRAFRAIRHHLARMNAFLSEHLTGMGAVQVFRQELRTQREFQVLNGEYRDANRQAIFFDALLFAVVEAIGTCAVAVLIWRGADSLAAGTVGAGTLVAFIQYIRRFFVPVRDLSTKYTVLQSAFAASERIFQILDEDLVIKSAATGAVAKKRIESHMAFDDVWFSYRDDPTENDWVVRGMRFEVRRGERVALVGATGSGKTTVLKLLNRFYDVNRGSVRIDGVDVRALDVGDLRRLFAVVLQDVHLFTGSVLENLSFSTAVNVEAVRRAVAAVGAQEMIARLPAGYDTQVNELGSNFSAGERQLLALARALALDPQVLVLDEATSNVDSDTESRIQAALDVVLRDRTALIVAHRLSTIRKVDRILVLQRGQLVEEGDHDTLMKRGGLYRTLVDLNFGECAA